MQTALIDKIFLAFICLLPFGHFFFKSVDIWHGQGHFFQVGLLILFCWSFFEKPKRSPIINKPLGAFLLWAGLVTGYYWIVTLAKTQNYAIKIFFPFFNFLCFILFYKLSVEYLDTKTIERILKWFRYSIIVVLFYCVFQYFKLDEFLKGLSSHDEFVGTIGNTSHLAGYLAVISPLFFEKKYILPSILLWLVILIGNSASGVFAAVAVVLFWLFLKRKYLWLGLGSALSVIGLLSFLIKFPTFFFSYGRFALWKNIFGVYQRKPITGMGLGGFSLLGMKGLDGNTIWRHMHNEYYQLVLELGIIGLILLFWCIWDYFKTFNTIKTDLTIKLAVMFFGFCILALFTFNAHLWMISGVAMISYSFLYTIKNEVENGNKNSV